MSFLNGIATGGGYEIHLKWTLSRLFFPGYSIYIQQITLQNSHFQEQLIWQNTFSRRSLIWENLFEEVCKIIFLSQWQKFMNYHEISFLTILRSCYVRFNINLALLDKSS